MGTTRDETNCSTENDTRRVPVQHTVSLLAPTNGGKKQRNRSVIEEAYEGNNSNKEEQRME